MCFIYGIRNKYVYIYKGTFIYTIKLHKHEKLKSTSYDFNKESFYCTIWTLIIRGKLKNEKLHTAWK